MASLLMIHLHIVILFIDIWSTVAMHYYYSKCFDCLFMISFNFDEVYILILIFIFFK